jgi:transcriptional regulator NrdR family protein
MIVKVIKRDNSQDLYDPEKIEKVVKAAGLNEGEAKKLSGLITKWIKNEKLTQLTSLQIRDRVVVEIQKMNKAAAHKYIWYEKYKDKFYGVRF